MLNTDPGRWGQRRPMIAGLCAELAEEFNLPVGVVRLIAVVFAVLPTGLTYLALALLANIRQGRSPFAKGSPRMARQPGAYSRDWMMMRQRFAALEPRLGGIEAFVTSSDFELQRGFRRMDRT